jgi:hypothetical protein
MDEEVEMALYVVACHVEGCQNENVVITLLAPAVDPYFVCGAHTNSEGINEQITDVTLVVE